MFTCPKCDRELRNPNQWHNCVRVNIGDLFKNKPAELELVFDQLLASIVEWEDVAVSATQNCVVFVHNRSFLIVRPMKTQLDLKFYSALELEAFPIIKSVPFSGKFENHLRVSLLEDLTTEVFAFIKGSYSLC